MHTTSAQLATPPFPSLFSPTGLRYLHFSGSVLNLHSLSNRMMLRKRKSAHKFRNYRLIRPVGTRPANRCDVQPATPLLPSPFSPTGLRYLHFSGFVLNLHSLSNRMMLRKRESAHRFRSYRLIKPAGLRRLAAATLSQRHRRFPRRFLRLG